MAKLHLRRPNLAGLRRLRPRARSGAGTRAVHVPSQRTSIVLSLLRGFILPLMLALVLFASLVYFVFPTRTWLDQRAEAAEVNQELQLLLTEQAELRASIARMRTPDEIERIARRDFNFVFPGEEAYAVLPAPNAPVRLPASWPFSLLYFEVLD